MNKIENSSPIKKVGIKGLFDRFDFEYDFEYGVNILIAENGFGKTTILNILSGLLEGNFNSLGKYNFDEAYVIYKNLEEVHVYSKDIISSLDNNFVGILHSFFRRNSPISVRRKLDFILRENSSIERILNLLDDSQRYYRSMSEYESIRNELTSMIADRRTDEVIQNLITSEKKIIDKINGNFLYLTTYRRIEDELDSITGFESFDDGFNPTRKSSINFGMNDVDTVINKLVKALTLDAVKSYSIMNTEIINELLVPTNDIFNKEYEDLDLEKAQIIIERIGKNIDDTSRLEQFVKTEKIGDDSSSRFLKYYFGKLIQIYESQEYIDNKIKKFVEVCNKYLNRKVIQYDEAKVEIKILQYCTDKFNIDESKEISLNDLSSGEKQIVALFSKLYLELEEPIIMFIDEPELSLSLDWQKMLLMDVMSSNKVSCLLVTTHSPFIFSNEYKMYARDMKIYIGDTKDE